MIPGSKRGAGKRGVVALPRAGRARPALAERHRWAYSHV